MPERVAVLDTDFLIKTFNIKNTNKVSLSEVVLSLDYDFCCHEQIKKEIKGHNNSTATWLNDKLVKGNIKCYSDFDLVELMQTRYQITSFLPIARIYSDLLRKACSCFSSSFYEDNYCDFQKALENNDISKDQFEYLIKLGDKKVGEHNNLGEIKSYLLTLVFNQCLDKDCFIFYSDDKNARKNIIADCKKECVTIRCVSVFGFFYVIKSKSILTKDEAIDFLEGWKKFNKNSNHISIEKENNKNKEFPRMNVNDVFEAIWKDELVLLNDGFLSKKTEN